MSCFYDRRTGLLPLEIEVYNTRIDLGISCFWLYSRRLQAKK